MKKVTHILSLFVVAALAAVAIAGCAAAPAPKDTVKGALDAIKAQDRAALQKYYAGDAEDANVTNLAGEASGLDLSDVPEEQRPLAEQLVKLVTGFEYTLGEEKIDGDKATVEATIKTYDLGTALSDTLSEYIGQALGAALSGNTDEAAMAEIFLQIFSEKASGLTDKTYETNTTFTLTKVDGEWKLDSFTPENIDSIMGGMLTKLEDLGSSFSELGNAA